MRTLSTSKEDILTSTKYDVHLRVEVEDSTGGMVDYSAWVRSARWDWDLDQPVPQLTVSLRRDDGPSTGESLAPLDAESTWNQNSTGGFGAGVYPGRDIDLYTAATTVGAAPATSEYDWVFRGELDEVLWERSPMQLVARSKNMSALADRWVTSSTYLYGSSSGDLLHTVIEQVLADWTDLSTDVLLVPTTPAFVVSPAYSPDKQPVLQAVQTLAQLIGWNLNEVWSTDSTSWRIQFSEPNRTATSSESVWSFGPQHYHDVRRMSVSRADVRNQVSVIYGPSTDRSQILAEDTDSQDDYGVQWMEFEEGTNSAIDSSSEANDLATAALNDLKEPPAYQEIELPYWYPGELGDYYEFLGNGIHYSTDQYLAAYGISHELSTARTRTNVRVRGQPAAYSLAWPDYPGGGNHRLPEIAGIEVTVDADANVVVSVTTVSAASNFPIASNIYVTVGVGSAPSDPTPASNDGSISGAFGTVTTSVKAVVGQVVTVKAIAANVAGVPGTVASAEWVRPGAPFFSDNTDRATTAGSTVLELLDSIVLPGGILGDNGALTLEGSILFTWGSSPGSNPQYLAFYNSTSANVLASVLFSQSASSETQKRIRFRFLVQNDGGSTDQVIYRKTSWDPPNSNGISVDDSRTTASVGTSTDTVINIYGRPDSTTQQFTLDWTLGRFYGST